MRRLSILGATGSVGRGALRIAAQIPISVRTITAQSNAGLLIEQAREHHVESVVIGDETFYTQVKDALFGSNIKVLAGREGVLTAAAEQVDCTLSAIVGFAGVEPSLIAAKSCETLALANKETLVCAGALLHKVCENGAKILPVDSEHSAIFQCINGQCKNGRISDAVERIILTASGGPFRGFSRADLRQVTPAQAAKHPNWAMGQRISIDSASMFNKAMELIETKELFGVNESKIEVWIHPQSLVHSFVGFSDGAMLAQLSPPDMAGAIGYALAWPARAKLDVARLGIDALGRLDFTPVDDGVFGAIAIARQVARAGGLAGCVLNAAKERALDLFLDGRIGFLDMETLVARAVDSRDSFCENTENKTGQGASYQTLARTDSATRMFVDSIVDSVTEPKNTPKNMNKTEPKRKAYV